VELVLRQRRGQLGELLDGQLQHGRLPPVRLHALHGLRDRQLPAQPQAV
jgi:hypothetical protein